MGDNNTQKMMTSNETHLTVAITDLNIYEGLYFNISQKPRLKKVLDLKKKCVKKLSTSKHKFISKDILCVTYDHNMERNLSLILKESDIFRLLFLGDGAIIYRIHYWKC